MAAVQADVLKTIEHVTLTYNVDGTIGVLVLDIDHATGKQYVYAHKMPSFGPEEFFMLLKAFERRRAQEGLTMGPEDHGRG